MNKIYKVIWSKVKHQYVVVSELAHRDGKRSSAASKSIRTLLAVLAVCGMTGFSMEQSFAAGVGQMTDSRYIAFATPDEGQTASKDNEGEEIYLDGHKYISTRVDDPNGGDVYYWVREGYNIELERDIRFQSSEREKDYVVRAYKTKDADTDGIVQSYQNDSKEANIYTISGDKLHNSSTGVYAGGSNGYTPVKMEISGNRWQGYTEKSDPWIYKNDNWQAASWDDFKPVTLDTTTGLYKYNGEIVDPENIYVIQRTDSTGWGSQTTNQVGVFVVDGQIYTGAVHGKNNEVLMTAIGEDGNYYTYWASEVYDPTATIGDMPISTFNKRLSEITGDITTVHQDSIKEIQVTPATGDNTNGGTIGLEINTKFDENGNPIGGKNIPGAITVTSIGGTNGNDVQVEFSNTDPDTKQTNSFTVNAGSKVEGKIGESIATVDDKGQTLDGISINGVDYKLGGGKTYSEGKGINISDDGSNTISVDITENGGLHFEGNQLASDLKVAADDDGDDNQGNWTITDTKGTPDTSDDAVFTNTTLASGAATVVDGSAVTSGDGEDAKTYGQSYAIKDTEGNTVTISDVASASALKDVDVLVTQNTSSIQTLQGQTVNGGSITDDGTIELKHDTTTLASISGLHDYALDEQTANAANGEVTLKGKDRYGNDDAFEVKIDGLVTEDTLGDQIVNSNNLKVAADADGDDNKGNWTITDTSKPEGQQVFTNTTLVNGAATAVEDSAVTSGDGEDAKTYGQSYAIKDTEGNTVTISDVASASALKDVDVLVTQNTSSIQTLQGQTVNGGSITDDGTIELKHDTTTLASISGLHDYALDEQTANAANGEVTLKGKDRYGNDDAFEVKIDGLVTEDTLGDQIVNSNNLKVAADADGDDNKGNWTITDTSKPEGQQVFTNTTLVNGAATAVEDSAVTSGDGEDAKTYGQSYAIKDTEGNTVTISDVASAVKLKEVAAEAGKHTSMTVDGGKAAGMAKYNGGNLLLKDNGDGQHQYDVKLNDDVYLGGDQTADNSNIALEGSTGSIHAATTKGNHTFDFDSNGGKFETTTVDDNRILGIGIVTTTTNTSEFGKDGATFTKAGKTETYVGDRIIATTPIPKTSTNIDGSKITSDAGVLGGQTVVDGGSVTVQGVGSILGTNTTTVEGSKITSVGTWGSLLGDTTEIDGAYINAGGIEVNGEPLRDTITGLSNTEWKNDEAWQKTHIRDDRAATEGQLQDVADSLSGDVSKLDDFAVKYDEVNGKPNYDKVTLEGKDGTKITNLAKGEVTATSTDAVNGSQLFEVQELAGKHTTMTVNNGMVAPEDGSYTTDGNLQLKQTNTDGQIEYDVKLNDNVSLGDGKIVLNGAPEEGDDLLNVDNKLVVAQDGTTTIAVNNGEEMSNNTTVTIGADGVTFEGYGNGSTMINGQTIQAGGIFINDGGNGEITRLTNTTLDDPTFATVGRAATEEQLKLAAAAATTTVSEGKNIDVKETVDTEDGHTNYEVSLKDNVSLGDGKITLNGAPEEGDALLNVDNKLVVAQDGTTTIAVNNGEEMSNNTTVTIGADGVTFEGYGNGSTMINGQTIQAGGIFINDGGNGEITRLTNTTLDDPTFATVGRAATEEQLKLAAAAATTTVSEGKNIDVKETVDTEDGHTNYEVSLKDNVSLGDGKIVLNGAPKEGDDLLNVDNKLVVGQDGTTTIAVNDGTVDGGGNNTTVTVAADGVTFAGNRNGTTIINGQTIQAGGIYINDEETKGTIVGLTNTEWTGSTNEPSRAATEGQLQQAAAASKTTLSNGKNTTVTSKTAEDGHVDYQVNLNDHIVLGDQDGKNNNISINGNEASIILNGFENGEYKNSIEIDAARGTITGLTNAIGDGKDGWETFTDKDTVHGSRAVTEDDLYEVYRHGVQYSVNDDGTPDYTTIVLGNPYNANTKGGGTRITNVAYATGENGSEAVNVDYLKDQISKATTTVTGNEKHIATNVGPKAEMPHADYSVGEDGKVTLTEVDGNGKPTGNSVVISDVASATDVGNVDKLVDAGLGVDENGNSNVVDAILDVDNKVGDLNYNDVKGDSIQNGDDTTTAIGKLDNRIDGLETGVSGALDEAKKHNTVEAGSNLTMSKNENANGGTEYKLSVDPNLKVDTVTATGNISAGSFSTGSISINKENSGTITGLSNTTWNKEVADAIAANANGEAGTAATQGQLQQAMNGAVQYDTNKDGSVNKDSITLGGSTYDPETHKGGTTITNVADGKNASDAVNMNQLWQTNQAVINNSNNISMLSNSVNKLDNRIDRVGAGAAALAALHPLDFDPDAKWDFAAGYGNYRGANAVAVGAYYRPNEDVMFSVGGSMGGGENMVNAGVSLKIGAGSSNVTTSRVAMAKEIKSMRDIVAKQDAQIQKLTAMVNALVGIQAEPDTTTMFPDVPENHWAYEAVEAMAKSGLVKGYPDGEFKGDRTMTRYEFAQIVYNAIQAGAEVDARLVQEFQPELQYFRVDTVAQDKNGNPTIQRVRVNDIPVQQ